MSNFTDSRGYHGNTKGGSDVGKYLKKSASGMTDAQVLAEMRDVAGTDVDKLNKMYALYSESMESIRRKAQKFATLILTRYATLSPRDILKKADKYRKKYDLSGDAFEAFINIAMSSRAFSYDGKHIPNTQMARTLGFSPDTPVKMNVPSKELDVLQDILRMYSENISLHAQVLIQSLSYNDNDECKIIMTKNRSDMFDPRKDNMYSNIHPVLFALFAPKINDIENNMVRASLGGVIASRYNGTQFKSQPDWELYHHLITDPNESLVSSGSTMNDLRNRVRVQIELWKNIRDLRQGRFYTPDAMNFLVALKACKNNIYDSPDFAFIEDEGSVLRRLYGVFSYRPTIVAIQSVSANVEALGGMMAYGRAPMSRISTLPMINVRLPMKTDRSAAFNLNSVMGAADFYVENKIIVPKRRDVVDTRGGITVYIDRRAYGHNFKAMINPTLPTHFAAMPFSVSGYERINDLEVEYKQLVINGHSFSLKSAVLLKTHPFGNMSAGVRTAPNADDDNNTLIIGSKTIVFCGANADAESGYNNPAAMSRTLSREAGEEEKEEEGRPGRRYESFGEKIAIYDPLNVEHGEVIPLRDASADEIHKISSDATIMIFTKRPKEAKRE